jgi:hypothetical protein
VVVDSNVFPRLRWLRPLIQAARQGYVQLIRSPLIIAEAQRLLTWLWLERHGGDLSDAAWRRCSEDAKRMFAHLTAAFHVVEDRPPAAGVTNWSGLVGRTCWCSKRPAQAVSAPDGRGCGRAPRDAGHPGKRASASVR